MNLKPKKPAIIEDKGKSTWDLVYVKPFLLHYTQYIFLNTHHELLCTLKANIILQSGQVKFLHSVTIFKHYFGLFNKKGHYKLLLTSELS